MQFSRTGSLIDLASFFVLCLAWGLGGWLLATHLFRLRRGEHLLAGVATGFLLYVAVTNLLAHWLPTTLAFWLGSILILAAGSAAAWRSTVRPVLDWREQSGWLQLLAVAAITGLFYLMLRGLAIFDDNVHLPLVSIMAAGDIPPHFYADPSVTFAYHYALQLFSAVAVRVGGFYPWSAWNLGRSFVIALMLGLGWLFVLRLVRSRLAATLGSFLITFGGGARWLLLLIPRGQLEAISRKVTMTNSGADTAGSLIQALVSPWIIDGGGPLPFPFAYHNGIFVPAFFILGSNGTFPFVVVLLMLLLATNGSASAAAAAVLGLVFATLALSGEHIFMALWGGIALALLIDLVRKRFPPSRVPKRVRLSGAARARFWQWAGILGLSGLLSVTQGAYLTEVAGGILLKLRGIAVPASNNYYAFSLRWPPALPSAHFGQLSILDPGQLVVLLAELGPVLLLFPLVSWYAWRCLRRGDWLKAGLGIAGAFSFIFPILFAYGVDRSSTRLPATSLWIWLLLGFPLLVMVYRRRRHPALRFLLAAGYLITAVGGIIILSVMLVAVQGQQASTFLTSEDIMIASRYWNRLAPGAQVLDSVPERAITIFGRASRARPSIYAEFPDHQALIANPDPVEAARAGYSYIYMNNDWWGGLNPGQKAAFDIPCARAVITGDNSLDHLRWIYDIRKCSP